ncbi:MAG: hypothetical protein AVDCRST_MAG03-3591 [uncultured Rubrobacteraceae bacterium]|uniref:Response regulatory domain-containing protein n=1 Tax=uncultured Rubrobacteraceae bacterium TaxID=349277 RepID=A0A6J4QBQ1_9ACTN|nr:MAG: hypothetical protein AVDCRST_MAG03-3591 [uncultured Rubrobacteraceae bacterium]
MSRRAVGHNMPGMRTIRHVLVANELASYRESIAAVLRFSFPDLEVFEATAADLNREILRVRPELVICSKVTSLVKDRVPNWVELYPECEPISTFCIDGECYPREQVDLSDLLALVDRPVVRTA